ncbi:hypothetical protein J2S43_004555 [Catenuloplanes nepalensis]|uniref:Proline dehydrogenase n=1 Tax=Catenuloplanes nepalensis TaxID=587533 RepID=A0ABT9MX73_9ACTN|nr:(2Fe-2S)-binding protein [Catenuloplanes nepalensis]MDP9796043.1 hypothetical protein [Catenuloplanes nepalensis]
MTGPYRVAPAHDPVVPADGGAIELTVDGEPVAGRAGQTIAGVLLASGRLSWRTSPRSGRPRGVFCGIGVCFDCLIVVNGLRDVRACQRRATDGDVITLQDDSGLLAAVVAPREDGVPPVGVVEPRDGSARPGGGAEQDHDRLMTAGGAGGLAVGVPNEPDVTGSGVRASRSDGEEGRDQGEQADAARPAVEQRDSRVGNPGASASAGGER